MNGTRAPVQPRKKHILNDYRQPLPATAEPLPGGKYPAQLMWEQKNNGAIVLKVNDGVYKEGGKNTHKEVDMDWYDRGVLFEALLEAANSKEFVERQVVPRKKQFVYQPGGGKMSDSPIVQVKLTIRREANGFITLGWSKGDYKAVFIFNGPRDMVIMTKGADGNAVEDHSILSRFSVRAYVKFHDRILSQMEENGWEPPKPREPAGGSGGGGGGYNNRNNGGGGGGSYNDNDSGGNDFDDDF